MKKILLKLLTLVIACSTVYTMGIASFADNYNKPRYEYPPYVETVPY